MKAKTFKTAAWVLMLMVSLVPALAIFEDISDIDLIKKPFQSLIDVPIIGRALEFITVNWIVSLIVFILVVVFLITRITSISPSLSSEEKRLKLQEKYLVREAKLREKLARKRMFGEEKRRKREERGREKELKQKIKEERELLGEIKKPSPKKTPEDIKENLRKLGWEDDYIEKVLKQKETESKKEKGRLGVIEGMCKEDLFEVINKKSPVDLEKVAKEIGVSLKFVSIWASELEKEKKIILKRVKDRTIAIKPEFELIQKDIMKKKTFDKFKDKISLTEILDFIKQKSKASVVDIADKFSIPLGVTKKYLALLEKNKLIDIKKSRKHMYAVAKEAKEEKLEKILGVKTKKDQKTETPPVTEVIPTMPESENEKVALYLTLAKKLTESSKNFTVSNLMRELEIHYKDLHREQRLDIYANLKRWIGESEFLIREKLINGVQHYKLIA